jgi:hypothetical protein
MKTITVSAADGDMFHIAAAQYGDFTQFWRLLSANAVGDVQVSGLGTLSVPPSDPTLSGGIPPQ